MNIAKRSIAFAILWAVLLVLNQLIFVSSDFSFKSLAFSLPHTGIFALVLVIAVPKLYKLYKKGDLKVNLDSFVDHKERRQQEEWEKSFERQFAQTYPDLEKKGAVRKDQDSPLASLNALKNKIFEEKIIPKRASKLSIPEAEDINLKQKVSGVEETLSPVTEKVPLEGLRTNFEEEARSQKSFDNKRDVEKEPLRDEGRATSPLKKDGLSSWLKEGLKVQEKLGEKVKESVKEGLSSSEAFFEKVIEKQKTKLESKKSLKASSANIEEAMQKPQKLTSKVQQSPLALKLVANIAEDEYKVSPLIILAKALSVHGFELIALSVEFGFLVRLIADHNQGYFILDDLTLQEHGVIENLELVAIPLSGKQQVIGAFEDVQVKEEISWRFFKNNSLQEVLTLIKKRGSTCLHQGPYIFFDDKSKLSSSLIPRGGLTHTLELCVVENLSLTLTSSGLNQTEASFFYQGINYSSFAVQDPKYAQRAANFDKALALFSIQREGDENGDHLKSLVAIYALDEDDLALLS